MPIASFAADLDSILAHAGVSVVVGGVTAYGRLRMIDVIDNNDGMEMQSRVTTLLVRTGALTLSNGVAATVDGLSYTVHSYAPEGDGQQTRIILARAS